MRQNKNLQRGRQEYLALRLFSEVGNSNSSEIRPVSALYVPCHRYFHVIVNPATIFRRDKLLPSHPSPESQNKIVITKY